MNMIKENMNEKMIPEIDKIVIGQFKEKIKNRKVKIKEKIKTDQDQDLKIESVIRKIKKSKMIVKETDNQGNSHVKKKIEEDLILLDLHQMNNVQDLNLKKVATKRKNKIKKNLQR